MPIYEYVCRECGEGVEKLQKLSDAPLTDCPSCGQSALKRKISAAGFRLSGGGWYETDFKSDGRRNLSGGSDESRQSGSASSTGKSEKSTGGESGSSGAGSTGTGGTGSASDSKSKAKTSDTGKSGES